MNVVFRVAGGDEGVEKKFAKEAESAGLMVSKDIALSVECALLCITPCRSKPSKHWSTTSGNLKPKTVAMSFPLCAYSWGR